MPQSQTVYRPSTDAEHAKHIREIMKESREVLKQPNPDTFLGRKTQEPFPQKEE